MLKKTLLSVAFGFGLTVAVTSSPVDLNLFSSDFDTLLTGVARDVAPSLRLGALAGDIQGDATIDHISITLPGIGFNATSGIARVLQPGATEWQFKLLPLADLVNNNVGDQNFFEKLMVFPALKAGVGLGFGNWDMSVSGIYFPQSLVDLAVDSAESDPKGTLHSLTPSFSFGNLGLQVRRTLIPDGGFLSLIPALSLGAGYHYTFFNLGVELQSLSDLGMDPPTVGANQTMDMSGPFGISSDSQVVTVDLHLSKHILMFTPFAKLSGAYQNSTFRGTTDLKARVTDSLTPANNSTQSISSHPEVNVSDFAFLVTSGLDVNLFLVNLNVNAVADMSRVLLKVRDLSLKGIDANAISVNAGMRISF